MTDKKLLKVIEGAMKGDGDSYTELIRMKGKNILYIATHLMGNKSDGEDAAQEAIIHMRESIKGLKKPESFEVWMYRLVYNVCMGAIRKMKNVSTHIELEPDEIQAAEDRTEFLPEAFVTNEEKRSQLLKAVDGLPESYRMCVMLFYYEDMSYAEVADVMGIAVQDVANSLSRAKKKLRYELLTSEEALSFDLPSSAKNAEKGGALAAIPVISQAFALDSQGSISTQQVEKLVEVAAGGITGGAVAAGTVAANIMSSTVVKAALGVACVLGLVGLGAAYLLPNSGDGANNETSVSRGNDQQLANGWEDGPAVEEVLSEDEAARFIEVISNVNEQEEWTEYTEEIGFLYQSQFLTGKYCYTVYTHENKANGTRLIVIERKDTAGAIKVVHGTDSGQKTLPQGTEIILAFGE